MLKLFSIYQTAAFTFELLTLSPITICALVHFFTADVRYLRRILIPFAFFLHQRRWDCSRQCCVYIWITFNNTLFAKHSSLSFYVLSFFSLYQTFGTQWFIEYHLLSIHPKKQRRTIHLRLLNHSCERQIILFSTCEATLVCISMFASRPIKCCKEEYSRFISYECFISEIY